MTHHTSRSSLFRRSRFALLSGIFSLAMIVSGAAQQTIQTTQSPQMPPFGGPPRDTTPAPTGTATMTGSVVNATGGRPVRRAIVRLSGTGPVLSKQTLSDDQGRFLFKDLPAGEFTLNASKAGYLDAIYGQKRPGSGRPGTAITLKDGQKLERIAIAIPRGGVIAGTIADDVGDPAYGTRVQAYRYVIRSGERTLQVAATTQADDRGMYRLTALPPGDYIVSATPPDDSGVGLKLAAEQAMADLAKSAAAGAGGGMALNNNQTFFVAGPPASADDDAPSSGYAPVYYPSTTMANGASAITLDIGEERPSIDLQLQLVPLGKITGTVTGDPKWIPGVNIQLIDNNMSLPGMGTRSTRPGPDGKFTFTNVAPGNYTLSARSGSIVSVSSDGGQVKVMMTMTRTTSSGGEASTTPTGQTPPMWATADVIVDGRTPSTAALVLQPGMTITGKLAFDGAGQVPTDLSQTRLVLSPASQNDSRSGSAVGQTDADGRFKITDVSPGTYKITATPPRGWRTASIEIGGRDVLDFPLEVKPNDEIGAAVVTFTDRSQSISGTLQDASGQPTSDYTVIAFAEDQRYWLPQSRRIMATRPATDGRFTFQNLPPGDYRLIAVTDIETGQWFDPAFLRTLGAGSIPISLAAGDTKTQDIRLSK